MYPLDSSTAPGAGGSGAPAGSSGGGSPTSQPSGTPSSSAGGAGSPSGVPASTPALTGTSPADQGPVPHARFQEINTKYQGVSWAEGMEKDRVAQANQLYDWFDTDPVGAYEYLTGQLRRSGHLPAESAPAQARGTNGTAPNFPTDQNGRPAADIEIQGTGQRLYSADQAQRLLDWNNQQLEARFKPLEASQTQRQSMDEANAMLNEAERWDGFKENAAEIYKELQKDRRLSLHGAYIRIVPAKIRAKSREDTLAEMRTRANASTPSPGSSAPASQEDARKLPLTTLFRNEMRRRGFGT